jgi:hypothetical protein
VHTRISIPDSEPIARESISNSKDVFAENTQMNTNTKMKLNKMLDEKTLMTQQRVNGFLLKTVKKIK